jgi:hypothetical protein
VEWYRKGSLSTRQLFKFVLRVVAPKEVYYIADKAQQGLVKKSGVLVKQKAPTILMRISLIWPKWERRWKNITD